MGEIGIRKVLGALRQQLFTQFTGESLLITFIALFLALIISLELLPAFNQLTGKQLGVTDLLQPRPLLMIAAFCRRLHRIAGIWRLPCPGTFHESPG